jgi:hypothetical protein
MEPGGERRAIGVAIHLKWHTVGASGAPLPDHAKPDRTLNAAEDAAHELPLASACPAQARTMLEGGE